MKNIQIGGKALSFNNGYIVRDVSDINAPEIITNTYDFPYQDGFGLNKLKIGSKKVNIVVSLRKSTSYEFFNEINDLKGKTLNQMTSIIIERDISETETVNLVGTGIVKNITIDSERAGMTFGVLTIEFEVLEGTFKNFLDIVSNYTYSGFNSYNLLFNETLFGNYKNVYPKMTFISNISNGYDRIRFEGNGFYIENIDIDIIAGKELVFDFEKGKIFYDGTEIDTNGIMLYIEQGYTHSVKFYKDGVLATPAEVDYTLEIRTRPKFI